MPRAVQAAAIRRRIRIPLRFADGYSTTATVVSFAGLADAQQHVALELGRPAAAALPLLRGGHELLSGSLEHAAEPRGDACPLPGPPGPGFEAR